VRLGLHFAVLAQLLDASDLLPLLPFLLWVDELVVGGVEGILQLQEADATVSELLEFLKSAFVMVFVVVVGDDVEVSHDLHLWNDDLVFVE